MRHLFSRFGRWIVPGPLGRGILLFCAALASNASAAETKPVDFLRDVRPILSSHCFKCHGPDETTRKGGLRLDIREEALQPAKSGEPAIVPGNFEKSELITRINATDEDDLMPPPAAKHPLTDQQKSILKQWIAQGADYQPHWAFLKPKQPSPPQVSGADWPKNPIDNFVLARLEKEGLQPSEPADKYALARRVYLDLIGLPPTPAQLEAFVQDESESAYERLVDHLLASPHYGERWARRWLDLARYADTNGYEKDRPRTIWPYRDWLINALNDDMPFDQFTVEQLAGDMLPNATPDQIIATGFHRNTMINEEGGIDPLEYRFYAMVDRVHVTSTAWLGLTIACAQCHTHKYDPVQHTEYYQLMALLNNADEPTYSIPDPKIAKQRKEMEAQIAEMEEKLIDQFPPPFNVEWTTPGSASFTSENGADGQFLKDGSILVTGKNPAKDNYTIQFNASLQTVSHLLLEAIPDPLAGKGGPGRTDHGNFVLSELDLEFRGKDGTRKATFAHAEADFSQDGFDPAKVIDGKIDRGGWAIASEADKRFHRRLILQLSEPVVLESETPVVVRLLQQFGGKHTLGRFRVSLGQQATSGGDIEQQRIKHRDARFAEWVTSELEKASEWTTIRPASAETKVPDLTIEEDGSVFASGDFTKSDTFKLKFENVPAGTRAIRIEALADDRLPMGGPGTVSYEGPPGDFFLSTIQFRAGGAEIGLTNASESFASGNNSAAKAIDDDLQSGWSVNGGQGKDHNAVFQLDSPLEAASDVEIDLTCERYYAAALGKFRISFTTAENARASALPPAAYQVLLKNRGSLDALLAADSSERHLLMREFAQAAPELASARKEIDAVRARMPKFTTTLVMRERAPGHSRETLRHHRGEFLQPKEAVLPDVPAFLPPLPPDEPANRLTFARWLVSRENPLTGRVIMNRHWEAFFGRGLVRTLEDFGFQGELPTHPELLDWLAVEFANQDWSQKKMHKLIVMSATYRQSSRVSKEALERDPMNVLFTRGPRFRLEAELIRDTALVASGLFSPKLGGPSVFPPQPASVTTEGAYGALQWKTSEGPDRYRRGLYTFAKRTAPYAMTVTFDGPSGQSCLAFRERSNSPLQALTLLNDDVFMECARALGEWAARQQEERAEILDHVFLRCLSRSPSPEEQSRLLAFFERQLARFSSGELKPETILVNENGTPEQAAWTALVRVLLNLDETITKS